MDNDFTAIKMMTKNCFMALVDKKDAYYCCSIAPSHQKYLKFTYMGQLYKYLAFPNGLAPLPRAFTKLLKPAYAELRSKGHQSVGYIDDSYLKGSNFEERTQMLLLRLSF